MSRRRNRKKNRLEGFDYSQNGYYFVTICTKNRKEYFGQVRDGGMILNQCGEIVRRCWFDLPNHYKNCASDEWIIMPNHIHGIVIIDNDVGTGFKPVPTYHSLSEIIRGFKTFSSRRINEYNQCGDFQWQRSFYDHIIRNGSSLNQIREYIHNNPFEWESDRNNPKNLQ